MTFYWYGWFSYICQFLAVKWFLYNKKLHFLLILPMAIMLFLSLHHQEDILKMQLIIKSSYCIVSNSSTTLVNFWPLPVTLLELNSIEMYISINLIHFGLCHGVFQRKFINLVSQSVESWQQIKYIHTLNAILKAHIISILVTEAYFSFLHSSHFFLFPSSFTSSKMGPKLFSCSI